MLGHPTLTGAIVCCEEYPQNGWPLVSAGFADELGRSVEATHIRVGPFVDYSEMGVPSHERDPETGRLDLTKVNPRLLELVDNTLSNARAEGLYVQVSLFDFWLMFNCEHSSFDRNNNVQRYDGCSKKCEPVGGEVDEFQKLWLTTLVNATKNYDNVIYEVGNESFRCRNGKGWEDRAIELIHSLAPGALVGSNNEAPSADYTIYHGSQAPQPEGKPVLVNEHDKRMEPEDTIREATRAKEMGTYFWYFRGSHSREEWERTLAGLKALR
jgi:hypothetical protein